MRKPSEPGQPRDPRALPPLFEAPRRRLLIGLVGVGVAQAVLAAAAALGMRALFDRLGATGALAVSESAWLGVVVLALAAAGVLMGLRVIGGRLAESLGQQYVAAVRLTLLGHLFQLAPRRHQRMRHGHLMARLTGDLGALHRWAGRTVAPLLVGAAGFLLALAALAWTLPMLALAAVPVGGALAWWGWRVSGTLERALRIERTQRWALAGQVGERLAEAAVVQAHAQGRRELSRLRRRQQRLHDAAVRRARYAALLTALPPALGLALLGAVAGWGSSQVASGAWTSGTLAGLLTLLGLTLQPTRAFALGLVNWRHWRVSREKLSSFLHNEPLPGTSDAQPLAAGDGVLELEGLRVDVRGEPLSLLLPARESLALQGGSGSGKSALLEALAGLLAPLQGRALLDGQDLAACASVARSAALALVAADLPLLRGSVAGNLRYRNRRASAPAMEQALQAAGVRALASGAALLLSDPVAEGGRNLPHGLRARLALARALAGAPRVLLIDDFDALIEGEEGADAPLRALLAEPPCTLLIATRRPEWAARCAQRLRLQACTPTTAPAPLELVHVAA
jgi:ABC-type multidrug transport system fused ATPase/permease subunit